MTIQPEERDEDDSIADLQCPDCEDWNTVYQTDEPAQFSPEEKWTGKWECVECGWRGLPMELNRRL